MNTKTKNYLYCFLAAFTFITICSKSSFIYPMNDWGDANCYFILGKGMLSGMVPYRDYFEQKGIVIYALYAVGILLSKTSFFGIYLIEIFFMAMFLIVALKIISLFFDANNYSFIIVFLLAGITCSCAFFCHGGSPEELLLAIFAYGIYLALKYFEKNECPNKMEMFIFGLFAGVIFFTKFTLCIIYISIILFMIIKSFLNHQTGILLKNASMFLLGCMITIIPVLIYFGVNNALYDFAYNYFYKNIFDYKPDNEELSLGGRFWLYWSYIDYYLLRIRNIFVLALIPVGQIWLIAKKKYFIASFYLFTLVSFFYLTYIVMKPYEYYALPLTVLLVFAMCAFADFFYNKRIRFNVIAKILFSALMIIIATVFTDNRYYMFKSKDSVPQYIFAKEMESYNYDDYHMLYYGNLDQGYYFASNTLPNCKAFVALNWHGDELKAIQKDHINKRKCEFIVSPEILCDNSQYEKFKAQYGDDAKIISFENFGYELIDEVDNYFEGYYFKVRLYKLKEIS